MAASRLRNELFRFRFGTDLSGEVGDNVFRLHIDSIGAPAPDEIWFTNSTVSIGKAGEFSFAECDDYLATHIEVSLDPTADFKDLTTQVYCELLRVIQERGYPNLIRAWNYFPGINTGDGDLEWYRQFTAGRALAFDEFAYRGKALPAGTAIGTDEGTPFTISTLATRDRCRMIENPRQISAYQYPREYGLSSPSFSRAVVVASVSGYRILMSGTASIVGHQSMHLDDPGQQTTETLRNLDELIQQARLETQTGNASGQALTDGYWRIYVRQPDQVPEIERALRDYLVGDPSLVFLRGDICRRELLLEIEAAGGI
jgi:chorismate lyase/3-hydroxybenzoate synthase